MGRRKTLTDWLQKNPVEELRKRLRLLQRWKKSEERRKKRTERLLRRQHASPKRKQTEEKSRKLTDWLQKKPCVSPNRRKTNDEERRTPIDLLPRRPSVWQRSKKNKER